MKKHVRHILGLNFAIIVDKLNLMNQSVPNNNSHSAVAIKGKRFGIYHPSD